LAGLVPCVWYSLYLSALPAWAGSLAGMLVSGVAVSQARALARVPPRKLRVPWGKAPACVAGVPVADLRIEWLGPLVRVSWRRGPRRRAGMLFWPDTLPPARRRELRLAARSRVVSSSRPAMAP
jgi:toxin CptA